MTSNKVYKPHAFKLDPLGPVASFDWHAVVACADSVCRGLVYQLSVTHYIRSHHSWRVQRAAASSFEYSGSHIGGDGGATKLAANGWLSADGWRAAKAWLTANALVWCRVWRSLCLWTERGRSDGWCIAGWLTGNYCIAAIGWLTANVWVCRRQRIHGRQQPGGGVRNGGAARKPGAECANDDITAAED